MTCKKNTNAENAASQNFASQSNLFWRTRVQARGKYRYNLHQNAKVAVVWQRACILFNEMIVAKKTSFV